MAQSGGEHVVNMSQERGESNTHANSRHKYIIIYHVGDNEKNYQDNRKIITTDSLIGDSHYFINGDKSAADKAIIDKSINSKSLYLLVSAAKNWDQ